MKDCSYLGHHPFLIEWYCQPFKMGKKLNFVNDRDLSHEDLLKDASSRGNLGKAKMNVICNDSRSAVLIISEFISQSSDLKLCPAGWHSETLGL